MIHFIYIIHLSFITYYEKIITDQFLICSINLKNGHFILKNNNIVVVKKILKYFNGQIELGVVKYNSYFAMSNTPIESNIVGSFYVSTIDTSDLFFIELEYIKNKCFFVTIPNEKAVVISLLHISE